MSSSTPIPSGLVQRVAKDLWPKVYQIALKRGLENGKALAFADAHVASAMKFYQKEEEKGEKLVEKPKSE